MQLARLRPTREDRPAIALIAALAVVWIVVCTNLQPIADWLTFGLLGLNP